MLWNGWMWRWPKLDWKTDRYHPLFINGESHV
jgi:hypothetical protein